MPVQITNEKMTSDSTPHTAQATDGGWSVTWLPGRVLTRNEAITAMTIAESIDAALDPYGAERIWPHVEGWAAELGVDAVDAVALASLPPAWHLVTGACRPMYV
jgi:hypothetical protein